MPIPDYDNLLVGQYIRAIENPDSVGYNNGRWYPSPRRGDDPNNRGFGVDIKYNNAARKLTEGRDRRWLSEEEERNLRNKHINYSEKIVNKWTPKILAQLPSEAKKAMAIGMVYRGDGVKSIIKNEKLRDAYYEGTDDDFEQAVSNFYNSKRLRERAKNHAAFMDNRPSYLSSIMDFETQELPPLTSFSNGGTLKDVDWNSLPMAQRAEIMKLAVENGIYNIDAIRNAYNEFAKGGSIHIKPENRGKFTALKKRTGHSASWFKVHGTPSQKKMATFALNARKWKHEYGGPIAMADAENVEEAGRYAYGGKMGNYYDGFGDYANYLRKAYHKIKKTIGLESDDSDESNSIVYRNKPAEKIAINQFDKEGTLVPKRQRPNNSQTKNRSESLENKMRQRIVNYQNISGGSNPNYDIPFIPEKAIVIGGSTTSTNALDSLAKYAGIHNREPKLSEHPILHSSKYKAPRKINTDEMLGLSTQETRNGAWPYYNMNEDKEYNRAVGNSNYFTAFGYIPADNFVRDFHYNKTNVDRSVPPLLDAFQYFAQGDYNRGNSNHTKDVNTAGKEAWKNPNVRKWWELSGKYWYNNGVGPK